VSSWLGSSIRKLALSSDRYKSSGKLEILLGALLLRGFGNLNYEMGGYTFLGLISSFSFFLRSFLSGLPCFKNSYPLCSLIKNNEDIGLTLSFFADLMLNDTRRSRHHWLVLYSRNFAPPPEMEDEELSFILSGIHTNLLEAYECVDRIRRIADLIIPIREAELFHKPTIL